MSTAEVWGFEEAARCSGIACHAPAAEELLGRNRCRRHASAIRTAAARWQSREVAPAEASALADPRAARHVLSPAEQVINASRTAGAEMAPPLAAAMGFSAWSWRAKQADPAASYDHNRIYTSQRPWRWPVWAYLVLRRRPKRLPEKKLFWMVITNIERGHLVKWEQSDGGAFYAAPDAGYGFELDGSISPYPRRAATDHAR